MFVTVTDDSMGNIIGISQNNPEYGYIRVEHIANQISEGGWLRQVKRSALIKGKVEDLKAAGYKAGDQIPGQIVVRESLEPFNPVNPERDLKMAGDTGVVCTLDDQPIYRETYFTNNPYAIDQLIAHNNNEQIKEAMAAHRALSALSQPQGVEL